MINIVGSVYRKFIFPADLATAFDFLGDMNRTLNYLPHISILRKYADGQYRMVFSSTELAVYRVRIICDIQADLDRDARVIRINPLLDVPPIKVDAGMYSLTGQGFYASQSQFVDQEGQTEIDYSLRLEAIFSKPFGLRLVPDAVIGNIAHNITHWRIHETADGYIERSTRAFQG